MRDPATRPASDRPKILVYGEEYETLSRMYITLLMDDYEVEATNEPFEVEARMKRLKPDLVLLNQEVFMDKDQALCEVIRKKFHTRILLVGCKTCLEEARRKGCPADHYLEKPVNPRVLQEQVRHLLSRPL
jgi:DNA-binding response OmpR family regulator